MRTENRKKKKKKKKKLGFSKMTTLMHSRFHCVHVVRRRVSWFLIETNEHTRSSMPTSKMLKSIISWSTLHNSLRLL
jgi:hypothetical protein